MNTRQHLNSTHLQCTISALLPGGIWHVGQLLARPCTAGLIAYSAMDTQAKRERVFVRGSRKA